MCDGMGGMRQALSNLGVEVTLFAATGLDKAGSRVVSAAWPEVVLFASAEDVQPSGLRKWLEQGPHVDTVVVSGCLRGDCAPWRSGTPSYLTTYSTAEQMMRCREAIRGILPKAAIHLFADLPPASEEWISNVLGVDAVEACSHQCPDNARRRLYWLDWPLYGTAQVSFCAMTRESQGSSSWRPESPDRRETVTREARGSVAWQQPVEPLPARQVIVGDDDEGAGHSWHSAPLEDEDDEEFHSFSGAEEPTAVHISSDEEDFFNPSDT